MTTRKIAVKTKANEAKAPSKRKGRVKGWSVAAACLWGLLMTGCANIGSPDGGRYDEEPPVMVGSSPKMGSTENDDRRIDIYFNEYIALQNASEKIVVSPPQLNLPEIAASGKRIRVDLQDSLKANTTYTIDFGDAIVDNNESNPMGQFAFVFSTGGEIDTMEVSGKVLNAQNLEPIKGMLVGLYQVDETEEGLTREEIDARYDSLFMHSPMLRVARTNGSGEFRIMGVKQGTYRAYALQDADGDFVFNQKSEMVAVGRESFTTGSYQDTRVDTAWHDYQKTRIDSLVRVRYTHYTPDNLVLLAFTEDGQERHLLKTVREVNEHFEIYFTAPCDEEPTIEGLNFDSRNAFLVEKTEGNDTLQYWLRDTLLAYQDTLEMALTYLETDTLGKLQKRTDTLTLSPKMTRQRRAKLREEDFERWEKEQKKRREKEQAFETRFTDDWLDVHLSSSTSVALNENVKFVTPEPIASIDLSMFHFYLREDSTFVEAPFVFEPIDSSLLRYRLMAEWRPLQEYRLMVDSAAMIGIYGRPSKPLQHKFTTPSLDTYSSLFVNLVGLDDTTAIVQLLNNDNVYRTVRSKEGRAEFYFIKPGFYYLRMFIDRNGNGTWDPGEVKSRREPEPTYYYPGKLQLRARWDVDQDWDFDALPVERQKPLAITKQKPDKEKKIQNRNAEREKNKD